MTAFTPWSHGPLAAQSLEDPVPYSLPAMTINYLPSDIYLSATSYTVETSPDGICLVIGPTLSTNLFTILTFPKVPLAITRSFPLLAPYELNSFSSTPLEINHLAAAEVLAIFPAGEMWSVVTESPKSTRQWASLTTGSAGSS